MLERLQTTTRTTEWTTDMDYRKLYKCFSETQLDSMYAKIQRMSIESKKAEADLVRQEEQIREDEQATLAQLAEQEEDCRVGKEFRKVKLRTILSDI